MKSAFSKRRRFVKVNSRPLQGQSVYNLSAGLDTYTANELLGEEFSPYLKNMRINFVGTLESRKGPSSYTTPLGETLNATQTSVTGASTANIGTIAYQAQKFTASATGPLTKISLNLASVVSPAPTGPVVIEIRSDNSGTPSTTILGTTGISASSLTSTTAAYIDAKFVESPALVNGTSYWIVAYIQDNGSNYYRWSTTTNTSLSMVSANSGLTWSANAFSLNFKTYIGTVSTPLGGIRFYRSGSTTAVVALKESGGTTGVYSVNDATGAVTVIKTGLSASATKYRFQVTNNTLYYCSNAGDLPRQWDGTTDQAIPGAPAAVNMIIHKNTMFLVRFSDSARIDYSAIGDFTSWLSVNFFYVPTPNNPDVVTALFEIQDNLVCGTRRTKYVLYGSDISSFTLRQSTGLRGIYSQELVKTRDNVAYCIDDNGAYVFDGAFDRALSNERIPDKFAAISNLNIACSEIFGDHWRIYHAGAGSAVNNQVLLYNFTFNSWFFDTNTYVSCAFTFNGGTDTLKLIEGSSKGGFLMYAEQGYNDMGRPITAEYRTKYTSDGDVPAPKQGRRFYPLLSAQDSSYNVTVAFDKDFQNAPTTNAVNVGGSGSTWGSVTWGSFTWGRSAVVQPRLEPPDEYNWLQCRVSRTGIDTPFAFQGYTKLFRTKQPI